MAEQKATNIHWHEGDITRKERGDLLGHGGATLWFTGLSGSGKSTVAVALEGVLHDMGFCVTAWMVTMCASVLTRTWFQRGGPRGKHSSCWRDLEALCRFWSASTSSFISPYVRDRDLVRQVHEEAGMDFIEVFVDCSLEAAESRDPKGSTKRPAGEIKNFTGIDDPMRRLQHPKFTCTLISRP